jgi:hypothetical protein
MEQTHFRLFRLLIAKSIAETFFVGTLAVVFFYTAFPPHFHGWGEATPDAIAGWVVNRSAPWRRVELQLFVDGNFVTSGIANLPRPDVVAAGWSKDEWHGYAFAPPPLTVGIHEARVYAIHESGGGIRRTLQLVGNPIRFEFHENGKLSEVIVARP